MIAMHQYGICQGKSYIDALNPFITSPTKKIIHTQANLKQKLTNCLNVFDHSVGVARKEFTDSFW